MENLIRRQSTLYGPKPVEYDGIPLMITNVGDETVGISLRFNSLVNTTPPIIYYNKTGKKNYKKWDLSEIKLDKGNTLYLFGENAVIDSTFVVNGNSLIHLDGKLEALCYNKVLGNSTFKGLFQNVVQLVSVGDVMPNTDTIKTSNPNLISIYESLFEGTNIEEIPAGFIKETRSMGWAQGSMYSRMFANCLSLRMIPQDLLKGQTGNGYGSYVEMFLNCEVLEVAADIYLSTQGFRTCIGMYQNCKKITEVTVYTTQMLSNHCMLRFVQGCESLKKIEIKASTNTSWGIYYSAMQDCISLQEVKVSFDTWRSVQNQSAVDMTSSWMKGVSPTGTFICPKELADETDGYYDEEGNFVEGVGRGVSTVPAGWTIDYPIIDARDGDTNAMALMAVIYQQTHADGTRWAKDPLVMMKSEAEKVESIKTIFAYGNCSAKDYTCMQYFVNSNFPNYCFAQNKMEKVTLPNTLSTISDGTFQKTLIDHINLPDSVTTILGGAFLGTINLKSIDFNKVTELNGYNHFFESGLESVYIPKTLTIGSGSFRACAYLESIIVEEGHPTYDSRENCNAIILKSNNSLIVGCNTTIIPASVTSIGNSAFNGSQISYIDIPASVTSIGWGAFADCKNLQTVILRKSTRYVINAVDFQNVPATFYVPDELLDEYKTAAVWSTMADRIKPISELP